MSLEWTGYRSGPPPLRVVAGAHMRGVSHGIDGIT